MIFSVNNLKPTPGKNSIKANINISFFQGSSLQTEPKQY